MAWISPNPKVTGHERPLDASWDFPSLGRERHFPELQQLYLVSNRSIHTQSHRKNPAQLDIYELICSPIDGEFEHVFI